MFQRRHYEAIAKLLREARPVIADARYAGAQHHSHGQAYQWEFTANKIADLFAADNPNFDRDRFRRAVFGETDNATP